MDAETYQGKERAVSDYPKFPAGELKVESSALKRIWNLRTSDDFMALLLAVDAYKREFAGLPRNLHIGYLGYARQDRVCNAGEPFSLKVVCDLINSLGFESVMVTEPHSIVTPALINGCTVIPMSIFAREVPGNCVVIAPDAGAEKRAYQVANIRKEQLVVALKHRDPATGNITATELYADDLGGKDCLIVDDICDGGATFIQLAAKLKEKNCGRIKLFVAHGLFTRGLGVFSGLIDEVYHIRDNNLISEEIPNV